MRWRHGHTERSPANGDADLFFRLRLMACDAALVPLVLVRHRWLVRGVTQMTRRDENLLRNSFFAAGMDYARCGFPITACNARPGLVRDAWLNGWKFFHGLYAPAWPV